MDNPINILKTIITKNTNPMINNLMGMAQNGNNKGVENFARNICKSKNIDFEKEFAEFMKRYKS